MIEVKVENVEKILGDIKILLSGVPGVTDRGWLGYCTVVLFPVEDDWALFDTGHYSDRHLLLTALAKMAIDPNDIRHVVLSHLHYDHILNLSLFKKALVYVSHAELDYAQRVSEGGSCDHSIPDFWRILLDNRHVVEVDNSFPLSATKQLKVLPGHTPGSMAMFCEGPNRVAVCGDVIKNAWEAVTGKSGMALAGEAIADSSIQTLMCDASVIIPGHDIPFIINVDSVEFLMPFQLEIRTSLYPEDSNQTVAKLYRSSGLYRITREKKA